MARDGGGRYPAGSALPVDQLGHLFCSTEQEAQTLLAGIQAGFANSHAQSKAVRQRDTQHGHTFMTETTCWVMEEPKLAVVGN